MSWRVGCKETGTEVVAASLPHTSTDSALMQLTARVSGSVFTAMFTAMFTGTLSYTFTRFLILWRNRWREGGDT